MFTPLLCLILISVVTGVGALYATEVTAKSELFRPIREFFFNRSLILEREWLEYPEYRDIFSRCDRFIFAKVADLASCALCQSFWHSFVIATAVVLVGHVPVLVVVPATLAGAGLAKVLHDRFELKSRSGADDYYPDDMTPETLELVLLKYAADKTRPVRKRIHRGECETTVVLSKSLSCDDLVDQS